MTEHDCYKLFCEEQTKRLAAEAALREALEVVRPFATKRHWMSAAHEVAAMVIPKTAARAFIEKHAATSEDK